MRLDRERAEAALAPLAQQLGLDPATTALGIVRVANAAVERAIRTISVERGIDPRDYTLVAFGGAGPLHAPHLARALGIGRVLVPRYPGVLSALGMISANMTRDYVRFLGQPLASLSPALLLHEMERLAEQASHELSYEAEQSSAASLRGDWTLDLRYVGQSHELRTPLAAWEQMQPSLPDLEAVAQRFHHIHQQHSGHALPSYPIEVVALRLKCVGMCEHTLVPASNKPPSAPAGEAAPPPALVQAALAAESAEWGTAALYERELLPPGAHIAAPAIVVQLDTTTIIPPGWSAHVDGQANLVLSPTPETAPA